MFSMPARRILQLGDPVLRAVELPSPSPPAEAPARCFADLCDTLHEFQRTHGFGRGISAVQIGEPKRLIYIELEGRAYQLRNPEYEWQSTDKFVLWDDCFSFPDLMVRLERVAGSTDSIPGTSLGGMERLEARGRVFGAVTTRDRSPGWNSGGRPRPPLDRESFCTREEYNAAPRAGTPRSAAAS